MSLQHSPSQSFDKNAAIHTMRKKRKKIVFLNEKQKRKKKRYETYMLYWAVRSDCSDRLKTISMQVQICSYWPRIY